MAKLLTPEEVDALLRNACRGDGEPPWSEAPAPATPSRPWYQSALQESPGEYSIRRIVFALTFVLVAALCILGIWWPITDNLHAIILTLIGSAFGMVTVGRFAEAMDK